MRTNRLFRIVWPCLLGAAVLVAAGPACMAMPPPTDLRLFVPDTVSPQAHALLETLLPAAVRAMATMPTLRTAADFEKLNAAALKPAEAREAALVKALGATSTYFKLGGVGVLETRPPGYIDDGTVLIRVHGGGWVLGSARAGASLDARMAVVTGRRVISVDYTLAPKAQWRRISGQVIAVYKALLARGYPPSSIGIYGDSAGANIVPGSVLKLRDEGIPMPGAIVLMSPCVDLHLNGDTETTLRDADPVLAIGPVREAIRAYADPRDWSNPYVSPIYGDFRRGFPPVLIQVGTKEMLLSESVRLYQAIKQAGGVAVLDVYEGMPHVFQGMLEGTPEQKAAFAESRRFWSKHLRSRKSSNPRSEPHRLVKS
jgi:epsilon-lactone hydrolase